MTPEIPQDETHRFLNWQKNRSACQAWATWFDQQGVPYIVTHVRPSGEHGVTRGWTIFKHQWLQTEESQKRGAWCCAGARA